ncbi:MAG: type IV pilus modification protein PilV [Gammaproteobacteria bacterium]
MKTFKATKKPTVHSGFTLIEVLIAVVILSIGLLGMAGIQVQGLRGTTSSTMRSQATILANDIAERIRVNTPGIDIAGDDTANIQYSQVNTAAITCVNNRPAAMCSAVAGNANPVNQCNSRQMATADIYTFACGLGDNAGVNNLLPGGSATISCTPAGGAASCVPGSTLTVKVNWTDIDPRQGTQVNKNHTLVFVP